MLACRGGNIDVARWLLKQVIVQAVEAPATSGGAPMHSACSRGHLEVAKWLHEQGAKVDAATNNGSQPIDLARNKGHDTIVSWLSGPELRRQPSVEIVRVVTAQERNEQGFANAISLSDDDDDDRVKAEKPPAAAAAGSAESISQKLARIKAELLAITGETVSNVKEAKKRYYSYYQMKAAADGGPRREVPAAQRLKGHTRISCHIDGGLGTG